MGQRVRRPRESLPVEYQGRTHKQDHSRRHRFYVHEWTVEFDETAEIDFFRCLEEEYTQAWLDEGPPGFNSAAPIFVLGQPRTGTTLIERIITSHSQVHSAGELQQFGLAIRRLSDHKDPRRFSRGLFESALGLDFNKVGALYIDSTQRVRGDAPHFVDKLPQNYLNIPLILKALPNAKIVHLTRNAMDACFASYKQLFADAYLHSYDLEEMARHHCRYRHLMDIWRERFPGRFLDISYEETVSDLEPNARALMSKEKQFQQRARYRYGNPSTRGPSVAGAGTKNSSLPCSRCSRNMV